MVIYTLVDTMPYKIPKGIEVEVYETGERCMLRFDTPLIAINENEAPFSSKMHRIFISKKELEQWQLIKK